MRASRFVPLVAVPFALFLAFPSCSSGGGSTFTPSDDAGGTGGDATTDGGPSGSCTGGKINCGGVCVDPLGDPNNCGACKVACGGGAGQCCTGVCVLDTPSCSFSVTSLDPPQGAVNGGDYVTLKGDGFAPSMRVLIDGAPAPMRFIDQQHVLVQTPPDVVGFKDVTILGAGKIATLPKGFLYATGGIMLPWSTKTMMFVRGEDPGLAVMQDGRVLIAGGTTVPDSTADALASAEIYDRSTDTVISSGIGAMSVPRWHAAAIPLMSGKVLVVGGACGANNTGCNGATDATKADLFDPKTNTFSPTSKPLTEPRNYPRAVLLADGRALIASADSQTADVYDPTTDSFTSVPTLAVHTFGFMVRLRDGRAMLGAGDGGVTAVELFDPSTNSFKMAAPLNQSRSMLTAHTLPDGRVMVIGGSSKSAGAVQDPLDTIETYDPKADKWTVETYKLSTPRSWHASALVRDGTVLVLGGYNVGYPNTCSVTAPSKTVDQIDPLSNTPSTFGMLPDFNTEWTAVTLLDGSIAGVGGGACGTLKALPEVYFLPGKPTQK